MNLFVSSPFAFLILISQFIIMISALLLPRQSGVPDIPASCSGNCTTQLTTFENCLNTTNVNCICNPTTQAAVFNCFVCLGESENSFGDEQDILNELVGTCDSIGLSLSPLALPGETSTLPVFPTGLSSSGGIPDSFSTEANGLGLNTQTTPTPSTTITLQETNSTPLDTPQQTPPPTPISITSGASLSLAKRTWSSGAMAVWIMSFLLS